jgi:hypothetical protein
MTRTGTTAAVMRDAVIDNVYDTGKIYGIKDAKKVLDLTYHSTCMRVSPSDMPDSDSLPLDDAGRRQWLHGYADGMVNVVFNENQKKIRQALALEIGDNDAGAVTVRDYLVKLLATAWCDEQSFDGKRPFGNSGWQDEVYRPLVAAGLIIGTLDEDGCIEDADYDAGEELILACIDSL